MSTNQLDAAIAVTRFGLGARPGEIEAAGRDPRAFLLKQINPSGAEQPGGTPEDSERRLAEQREMRLRRKEIRDAAAMTDVETTTAATVAAKRAAALEGSSDVRDDFMNRIRLAAGTGNSFGERWVLFWANHFTVSVTKPVMSTLVGPFEQEVIRPHAFGRFADLLAASSQHPAMLLYLDQADSVGPGSRTGQAAAAAGARRGGLNENLAREILELHTLGLDGGYTQQDVTEFARALTGWSVGRLRDAAFEQGKFLFRVDTHEPGQRTVRGKTYAEGRKEQGDLILRDLASARETARHCCTKIARHFVADDPPPALIDRLVSAWAGSDGRLDKVAAALVQAPEAWDPTPRKFKTPYEFIVSAYRAMGAVPDDPAQVAVAMNRLGQRAFGAPSPKGWPDVENVWCAPDALVARMEWAERIAASSLGDPVDTAQQALGGRLTPRVARAIQVAESRREAVAILLMSPEFQRR